VALNGKPLVNGNPNVDPGFRCEPGAALNACLALPLQGPAGFSGVLALYRRRQDSFSRDDLRILAGVASKITVAIDNALVYRQMELRSNLDALTELPNSRLMMQNLDAELERARRQQQGFCITVCNLSGLAALRLSSGRDAGDELLRQVATAIKESCRRYDHVGRIGEDRFALILPGMTPQDMAVKASGLEAVVAGLAAASHPGTVRLVCGAAFYPEDGDLPKLLLAIAERRAEQHLADLTASITALDARVGRPATSPVTAETAPGR
jgi:diguanylate cyclase (GGDEF)-like protein